MPRFTGEHIETFRVELPAQQVLEHFLDPRNIVAAYVGLQRWEKIDDHTLRLVLEPQSALGSTFQGTYVCQYDRASEHSIRWKSTGAGDNMESEGEAEFVAEGASRTRVTYRDRLTCDIPINRLLAKALTPIVERNIRKGVKEYVERMRASLETG